MTCGAQIAAAATIGLAIFATIAVLEGFRKQSELADKKDLVWALVPKSEEYKYWRNSVFLGLD